MNQVERTLQAITTSIAVLEKSEKPNQSLLESLRKERDSILNEIDINSMYGKVICMRENDYEKKN